MGMIALPAPRSTAERLWEAASRQKYREQILHLPTPKAMASGSLVKAPISQGAVTYITTPMSSASRTAQSMPKRAPFFARSYSFAPRFWPTKVVKAMVKLVMGKKAKPSILA